MWGEKVGIGERIGKYTILICGNTDLEVHLICQSSEVQWRNLTVEVDLQHALKHTINSH